MPYSYRRDLTVKEQLPALGAAAAVAAAGMGAAAVVFYFARVFVARTPLLPSQAAEPERPVRGGAAAQLRPPARGVG